MMWIPNGRAIRRARLARGWTVEQLASWTTIQPRTLRRWEDGKTRSVQRGNLEELAVDALHGKLEEYGWPASHLRDGRAHGPPSKLTLAARDDIHTTWRNFEDRLFEFDARVEAQAPPTDLEAIALGWHHPGIGARFDLVVGAGRGTFRISVYAPTRETVTALQAALVARARISLTAVLVVVETSADHPTLPDPSAGVPRIEPTYFARFWTGFTCAGHDHWVRWALEVTDVGDGKRPRAQPPRMRDRSA